MNKNKNNITDLLLPNNTETIRNILTSVSVANGETILQFIYYIYIIYCPDVFRSSDCEIITALLRVKAQAVC